MYIVRSLLSALFSKRVEKYFCWLDILSNCISYYSHQVYMLANCCMQCRVHACARILVLTITALFDPFNCVYLKFCLLNDLLCVYLFASFLCESFV